jgi:aminoglycoside phosphotransferase (APT) family kinase protein
MTYLPGRTVLAPADPDRWLRAIVEVLPTLHTLRPPPTRPSVPPAPSELSVPATATDHRVWEAAFELVTGTPPPSGEVGFVHGDYQPFNLLWSRQRLTGIVDWTSPRHGPPDADPAHCRLNIVVLYSVEEAERFRGAYEAVAARPLEPWWDIRGLLRFNDEWHNFIPLQVSGRMKFDIEGMTERVERLLRLTLDRLG